MTTGATGQLGLALPVQGELSGTWGDTVNNGITQYTNIAIAGTLTLTGDGAVTLANTTGDASASNITSTLAGAGTVTAQFAIVRVTGTLTVAKVVTGPSYSKTYTVVNAATGGIVTFKASGQTGVSVAVGESAFVYFNGTDYVKIVGTATAGAAGGSTTQVQYNNAGVLAGITGATTDGTALTLVAPILGTPASATLTNATGLPIATGVSGLGTGVATFLATPSSANLRSALTDETGTGSAVFATSPTLVTPILGTPTSATLTNATGLPLTTGVTGTLPTANGGTGLTSFTSGGVVYASSTSALATGSALTFDGTNVVLNNGYIRANNTLGYYTNLTATGLTNFSTSMDFNSVASHIFSINSSEIFRTTSTSLYTASGINVGIGTSSPSQKLDVSGNINVNGTGTSNFTSTATSPVQINGTSIPTLTINNSTTSVETQIRSTTTEGLIRTATNHPLLFGTNATTKLTLDTSGNLGLGVTPSAWSLLKAFQIGNTSLAGYSGTGYLMTNAYFDGSVYRYTSSNYANLYTQNNSVGQHAWNIAASGTAGDAISFTQAMSLTADGNLLVGTTGDITNGGFAFNPLTTSSGNSYQTIGHKSGTASGDYFIGFYYAGGPIGSITQNGTTATAYNTSSDYRLKDITGPITTSGAYIDSLNPVEGTWKSDGSTFVGLIAHEAQESSRTTVATGTKDGAEMQSMDYSNPELIANLIAEVKSLRQRVATLEAQ